MIIHWSRGDKPRLQRKVLGGTAEPYGPLPCEEHLDAGDSSQGSQEAIAAIAILGSFHLQFLLGGELPTNRKWVSSPQ